MKISDYPKFESALSQGRPIIFLCGAGLSVSLGDHAKGWVGWLKEGKAYLSDVEAEELDRRFGSYSASELIDAASFLIEALRKNGNYTAYMDSTIGSLRVQNKKLANALALFVRCGDYFATTNYDKLLEEVTGLGCYGMEYSDLSNAVEDMANYRIRTRYRDSGIIRVNPYVKTRKSFTASYRLHYLNEFCKFVGREKELVELNRFCSADKELLWWSLVGKGGIGKSRLVYQWLKAKMYR